MITLKDKQVGGLTLRMLGKTGNMNTAKECAVEGLYALAERDLEWVNFLKETHGIEIDYAKLRSLYLEAEIAIRNF